MPYEWQQKMEGPVAFPTCTCEEERAERKNTRYINRIRKRMDLAEEQFEVLLTVAIIAVQHAADHPQCSPDERRQLVEMWADLDSLRRVRVGTVRVDASTDAAGEGGGSG